MPSSQRLSAFQTIQERPATATRPTAPPQEPRAQDVFDLAKMKAALPKDVFKSVQKTIKEGGKLDGTVANVVAQAMKEWATSRGAL